MSFENVSDFDISDFDELLSANEVLAGVQESCDATYVVLSAMLRSLDRGRDYVDPKLLSGVMSQYAKVSKSKLQVSNKSMSFECAQSLLFRRTQKVPVVPDYHTLMAELMSQNASFEGVKGNVLTLCCDGMEYSFDFSNGPFDVLVKKGGVEIIPRLLPVSEDALYKLLAYAHAYCCNGGGKIEEPSSSSEKLCLKLTGGTTKPIEGYFKRSDETMSFLKRVVTEDVKSVWDGFRLFVASAEREGFIPYWVFYVGSSPLSKSGNVIYKTFSQVLSFMEALKTFDCGNSLPLLNMFQKLRKNTVVDQWCSKDICSYLVTNGKDVCFNESVISKLGNECYSSIRKDSVVAVVGVDSKGPNLQVRAIKQRCESVNATVYYYDLVPYVDTYGLGITVNVADITKDDGLAIILQCKPTIVILDTCVEDPARQIAELDKLNRFNVIAANKLMDRRKNMTVYAKAFGLGNIESKYSFTIAGYGRKHSGEIFIKFGDEKNTKWSASYVTPSGNQSVYSRFVDNVFSANLSRGRSREIFVTLDKYGKFIPMIRRRVLNKRFIITKVHAVDLGDFSIIDDCEFEPVVVPRMAVGVHNVVPFVLQKDKEKQNDVEVKPLPETLIGFEKKKYLALSDEDRELVKFYVSVVLGLKENRHIQVQGAKFNEDVSKYLEVALGAKKDYCSTVVQDLSTAQGRLYATNLAYSVGIQGNEIPINTSLLSDPFRSVSSSSSSSKVLEEDQDQEFDIDL